MAQLTLFDHESQVLLDDTGGRVVFFPDLLNETIAGDGLIACWQMSRGKVLAA